MQNPFSLEGKNAWITGASYGIGFNIAKAFVAALNGENQLLLPELAQEMAKPVKDFPWTGLGVFIGGEDILVSQGWGENGQCMLKMNLRTKEISVVMTNQNPGVDQTESGIERLVNEKMV